MDNMNFKQEERAIKDILTPKHTPKCNIKFESTLKPRRPKIMRHIRIATIVAATLANIIIFATTKINFVEKAQAMPDPMEMISKGLKKFTNVKSLYLEFRTKERIKIGLPVKDENKMTKCKLYFLQEDSAVYMREEWDDEYNTVAIYDKDSLHLWQNGKLQKKLKIPFRPARYEYLFNQFSNIVHKHDENGYIIEIEKATNDKFPNIPVEEIESIEVIKDEKTIKIETAPAAKYEPFYELYYSVEKEEFTKFKIVKKEKDTNEKTILMETTKLAYNHPNTVKEITKRPD